MSRGQFSPSYLRQRTHSTTAETEWIGATDRLWYSCRTATGTHCLIVAPCCAAPFVRGEFREAAELTEDDVHHLVETIRAQVLRLLRAHGL